MATPNFSSILDKPIADVERPLPWPAGSYIANIKGKPSYDVSSKKKTPYVEFVLSVTGHIEGDVDEDELAKYEAKHGKIVGKTQKVQFYLTPAAEFMLKDFLKNLGLDVEKGTIRDGIDNAEGNEIGFIINHEPTQDGEGVFARVGRTFAIAE